MSEQEKEATGGVAVAVSSLAGKYLTFRLQDEEYGIGILKVVEIIKMMDVTQVPRTPEYVRGVVNLRGKVIPVVELRRRFDMAHVDDDSETCIIVVNVSGANGDVQMGILVDTVSEVLDIEDREIEPPPSFGGNVDTGSILGMAKSGSSVKILLDIDRVLAGTEAEAIALKEQ